MKKQIQKFFIFSKRLRRNFTMANHNFFSFIKNEDIYDMDIDATTVRVN